MFRPMALTVVFALVGSLILVADADAGAGVDRVSRTTEEREPRLVRWLKARYRPLLGWTLGRPGLTGGMRRRRLRRCRWLLVPFMGSEFIPRLDEGASRCRRGVCRAWR